MTPFPSPTSESVSNPHDAYAKSVFRRIPLARGFFRAYLPDDIQRLVDWRTLRLETESYLSDELKRGFADLRFIVCLVGDAVRRRITRLFEHKYRPIYTTPRQLLRYISQQMEETPANEPLPSILAVVLLQSGSWNRLRSLSGEYDLPEPARQILTPYLVDFRMVMVELAPLEESDLKGTEAGRLALALLKTIGEGQPLGWLRFRTILSDICQNLPPEGLRRELRRALYDSLNVMDREQETEVRQALQWLQNEFLPVKENIVTLLEHLEKRGEKRGEQRGRKLGEQRGRELGQHLGKVATLVRQLSAAFPEFTPANAEQVRELADETLDELADAVALRRTWAEIETLLRRRDG